MLSIFKRKKEPKEPIAPAPLPQASTLATITWDAQQAKLDQKAKQEEAERQHLASQQGLDDHHYKMYVETKNMIMSYSLSDDIKRRAGDINTSENTYLSVGYYYDRFVFKHESNLKVLEVLKADRDIAARVEGYTLGMCSNHNPSNQWVMYYVAWGREPQDVPFEEHYQRSCGAAW